MDNSNIFTILLIVLIWVIILAIRIGTHLDDKIDKKEEKIKEKRCPPHKWRWERQEGIEPETHFIRCQNCRRLPGWDVGPE